MSHKSKIKKNYKVLIKSRFYFELPLQERLDFLKNNVRKPWFFREAGALKKDSMSLGSSSFHPLK